MNENREYKSDVFSMLMEDKRYALEVYNALNGSAYTDPEQVEMVRLERGVSLSIRNDAAFTGILPCCGRTGDRGRLQGIQYQSKSQRGIEKTGKCFGRVHLFS